MSKINDEIISRISPNGDSRQIYYGMACEYTRKESHYTTEIKDLKKDRILSVDYMRRDGDVFKVIYLKPTMKVILKNDEGKQFIGVSTCYGGDQFHAQIGYAIAMKRATIKKLLWELKELTK